MMNVRIQKMMIAIMMELVMGMKSTLVYTVQMKMNVQILKSQIVMEMD